MSKLDRIRLRMTTELQGPALDPLNELYDHIMANVTIKCGEAAEAESRKQFARDRGAGARADGQVAALRCA